MKFETICNSLTSCKILDRLQSGTIPIHNPPLLFCSSTMAEVAKNSTQFFNCDKRALRNFFLIEKYACRTNFFGGTAPLGLAAGYVVVLAFGLLFGLFTVGLVYLERKISGTEFSSVRLSFFFR